MKRINLLLIGLALCAAVAVGYSDSHEIKTSTIQVDHSIYAPLGQAYAFASIAELPAPLVIDAPDLGRPASNYIMVSEELTDVFKMCIRPPPEKVQKSDYTNSENQV